MIALSPLPLKREDTGDGCHKYYIRIDDSALVIRFKDALLSDSLFAGWFPFLALKSDKANQVKLYQAQSNGGLVEWTLEKAVDALHYKHHRFVNTVPLIVTPGSGDVCYRPSLLSLDIASLKSIRDLVHQGFIINQNRLLPAILRPSRLLIFDEQGIVRYLDKCQVSASLATQIEERVGPKVYSALADPLAPFLYNEDISVPGETFITCFQRWESKNQLIQALCLPQPAAEGNSCPNHHEYTHFFSYTPEDLSWVCHCIGVTNRALNKTSTVCLLESGEAGLISGAYISSLDTLIISPHLKNGIIDHSVFTSRLSAAMSCYCGTSAYLANSKNSKYPTCILLALTNNGNLYHLIANDLYGIFSSADALNNAGIEFHIKLGKGHGLLPFYIPPTCFNGLHKPRHEEKECEENNSTQISLSALHGPIASSNILTLAKAPYCLTRGPLAYYKEIIAEASRLRKRINQIDLHSCSLTSTPESFFEKEINFIVFGIRCARRKPVNQLELLEATTRIANSLNRYLCIIIEGTYSMTGSLSESEFIAEESSFVDNAQGALERTSELTQILSFVGKPAQYSTYSAFLDATVIAPWGAGLARHMFSAEKSYIIHTNAANHASMTRDYYSWEIPYRPKHIDYITNIGDDINCAANEEVKRLDPSRPNWSIFNDYVVNIEHFSEKLTHQMLGSDVGR